MATNLYVDNYQNQMEQNLYEDLTIEAIQFHGVDMIYMARESIGRDNIYGEDLIARFQDANLIEMYLESNDSFGGGGDMLGKFGLTIPDTATFIVSKRRFQEIMQTKNRPMEGDLLYFPLSGSIFEINFTEHENPFYQTGKLFTYKLTCELYSFSQGDQFDVDIHEIDEIPEVRSVEKEIERADNGDIQREADLIFDKSGTGEYPNVSSDSSFRDNTFDSSDPFGDN